MSACMSHSPLADRIYGALTKRSKTTSERKADTAPRAVAPSVTVPLTTIVPILFVGGGVIVSSIAAGGVSRSIIVGYLILTGLLLLGVGVARLTRGKIAAMIAIITIGAWRQHRGPPPSVISSRAPSGLSTFSRSAPSP